MDPSSDFPDSGGKPLPLRFVIYIPAEAPGSLQEGSAEAAAEAVAELLCERFGGVTCYPATGIFKGASGAHQKEEVQVLECFCELECWAGQQGFVHTLAGTIAAMLGQESIACSVNGRMNLVPPDPRAQGEIPAGEDPWEPGILAAAVERLSRTTQSAAGHGSGPNGG